MSLVSFRLTLTLILTHANTLIQAEQKTLKPFINWVCCCYSWRHEDLMMYLFCLRFASRDEWINIWCIFLILHIFLLYVTSGSSWSSPTAAVISLSLLSFVSETVLAGPCGQLLASSAIFLFILVESCRSEKRRKWIENYHQSLQIYMIKKTASKLSSLPLYFLFLLIFWPFYVWSSSLTKYQLVRGYPTRHQMSP